MSAKAALLTVTALTALALALSGPLSGAAPRLVIAYAEPGP